MTINDCPICGSSDNDATNHPTKPWLYSVMCFNCGAYAKGASSESHAIYNWNNGHINKSKKKSKNIS